MGCFGKLDHIEMSEVQLSIKNGSILFLIWLTDMANSFQFCSGITPPPPVPKQNLKQNPQECLTLHA